MTGAGECIGAVTKAVRAGGPGWPVAPTTRAAPLMPLAGMSPMSCLRKIRARRKTPLLAPTDLSFDLAGFGASAEGGAPSGPGVSKFERVGGLEQAIFAPGGRDDLNADGETGGVVVVDGDRDGGLAGHVK